jgi:hypothetical protein
MPAYPPAPGRASGRRRNISAAGEGCEPRTQVRPCARGARRFRLLGNDPSRDGRLGVRGGRGAVGELVLWETFAAPHAQPRLSRGDPDSIRARGIRTSGRCAPGSGRPGTGSRLARLCCSTASCSRALTNGIAKRGRTRRATARDGRASPSLSRPPAERSIGAPPARRGRVTSSPMADGHAPVVRTKPARRHAGRRASPHHRRRLGSAGAHRARGSAGMTARARVGC